MCTELEAVILIKLNGRNAETKNILLQICMFRKRKKQK